MLTRNVRAAELVEDRCTDLRAYSLDCRDIDALKLALGFKTIRQQGTLLGDRQCELSDVGQRQAVIGRERSDKFISQDNLYAV